MEQVLAALSGSSHAGSSAGVQQLLAQLGAVGGTSASGSDALTLDAYICSWGKQFLLLM